jgi:hypothetical protein
MCSKAKTDKWDPVKLKAPAQQRNNQQNKEITYTMREYI